MQALAIGYKCIHAENNGESGRRQIRRASCGSRRTRASGVLADARMADVRPEKAEFSASATPGVQHQASGVRRRKGWRQGEETMAVTDASGWTGVQRLDAVVSALL